MTDKKTEALKLALEALEESLGYVEEEAENAQRLYDQYPTRQARIQGLKDDARKHMNAITATREALAEQPAQPSKPLSNLTEDNIPAFPWVSQKPVAWMHTNAIGHVYFRKNPQDKSLNPVPLYTSPPASKPWVGLTDEQILSLVPGLQDCLCDPWDYNNSGDYYASIPKDMIRLARAIEAKLKEKNT